MIRHIIWSCFLFILAGCSTPMYTTKQHRDKCGLMGVAYYKTMEVKGVLTIDPPASKDPAAKEAKGAPPAGAASTGTIQKMSLSFIYRPTNKAYLYLNDSPAFANTVNFKVTDMGTPSSSDTQSTQAVTTILNDLGTTLGRGIAIFKAMESYETGAHGEDCQNFAQGIYEFSLNTGPTVRKTDGKYISLKLNIEGDINKAESEEECAKDSVDFNGFCAYDPSPIKVSILCDSHLMVAPQIINSYSKARVVNPHRTFLSNRHETYTITNGVVTEEKFDAQSAVKGVFDLVLSPIKGVLSTLPTSTTTQTTTLVTGGDKADQTTRTSTTTTGPPK